jgi:Amidases related to nicotinamidase
MSVALLIVDMQHVFLRDQIARPTLERACEYINFVAKLVRRSGHHVVHVRDVEDLPHSDDPESFEVIPEIVVDPNDLHVEKTYSNAFWKTELEQSLVRNNVDFVIVAGQAVEHCVLATYQGATERGFATVLLQNGVLSTHEDVIRSAYRDRNLISHTAVQYMLR